MIQGHKMKVFILIVTSLASVFQGAHGQCCGPYQDYETYVDLYLGYNDITQQVAAPEAYFGRAR